MKLTRDIRNRIMSGECPHIGGEGLAPIKVGHTWQLSEYVRVTVTRIDHKKGRWSARYTVADRRDLRASADRYVRRVPRPEDYEKLRATFDDYGYPAPAEVGDTAAAAESAYTSRADLAVDPAPVVPPDYLEQLAKSAEDKSADMRRARIADAKRSLTGLSDVAKTRDAKRRLRRIEHDLEALAADSDAA